MGLEFENEALVMGRFGDVCDTPLLDWRHKCQDEVIASLMLVLVDIFYEDFTYKAIISSSTSINFREAWGSEGGSDNPNCCPSTANSQTKICEFKLPALKTISIGTEPRCYDDWYKRFCKSFPRYRSYNPFVPSPGGQITLRRGRNEAEGEAFLGMVANELSQAIWNHLYMCLWVGRDEYVDQYNGIMYYFENGIAPLTDCTDYPTKPTCINMAEYIVGAAAAANGELVGPGDIILPVGDPARPADAPATNILTVYGGTLFETTIDLTGMDTVDVLKMWYELLTNEWMVDVRRWMLGIPKSGSKCLAQVAACKQSCNGDCRSMLRAADQRDFFRAEREAQYIRDRILRLYPYEDTIIPMRQSPVLRQFNRIIFVPEQFADMDGTLTNWMLWVWLNRRSENEKLFNAYPPLRDMLPAINENSGVSKYFESAMLYDGAEFETMGDVFESQVFDWLWDRECNSVRWWNNATTGLLPQAPHLWLCIDGVTCDTVLVLPCVDPQQPTEHAIATATDGAAGVVTFGVSGDAPVSESYTVGDKIDVQSAAGTTYKGVVTALSDPGSLTVTFNSTSVTAAGINFVSGYTRVALSD